MDTEQTLPVLMRQSKLCHTLGLGVRELHKLVREGKVRQIKIGKYAKYCVAEVAAVLGLTVPPTRVAMVWIQRLSIRALGAWPVLTVWTRASTTGLRASESVVALRLDLFVLLLLLIG